jgi:hypothetical protein
MIELIAEIEIAAPPEKVWGIIADFDATPLWNPFIRSIEGPLKKGERITARIAPAGRAPMMFKPILLAVEPAQELRWRGSLLGTSVFAGEHCFRLERTPTGETLFIQSEKFSGMLAPLIMSGSNLKATREGFIAMNEALKRRAEAE